MLITPIAIRLRKELFVHFTDMRYLFQKIFQVKSEDSYMQEETQMTKNIEV